MIFNTKSTPSTYRPFTTGEKVALVTGVVLIVLGLLAAAMGFMHHFGAPGSLGYYASVGGGIVLTGVGIAVMIKTVLSHRAKPKVATSGNRADPAPPKNGPIDFSDPKILNEVGKTDDENVILNLRRKWVETQDILEALLDIPQAFFDEKSQERAMAVFTYALKKLLGCEVAFPRSVKIENPENLSGKLKKSVFRVSHSDGVENEIPRSSFDKKRRHVYQVASQDNCGEAPDIFTPGIAEAWKVSKNDRTQGPLAQRTNFIIFELVTAFLTHLGFSMLANVLPPKGNDIKHGYFRPKTKNKEKLTEAYKKNYHKAQYACYTSLNPQWGGTVPVSLFLQAAPATAYAGMKGQIDEIEKYAALANYLAFFKYGLDLAKESGQPVVLHATAVGGSAFGNKEENIRWGFEKAALALQDQMEEAGVFVQLESRNSNSTEATMAKNLGIQEKARK
jgi:hypothetical protein